MRLLPLFLLPLFLADPITTFSASDHRFLVSSQGSGRATAYLESPKIITYDDRTHVAWLDSVEEGFRVRIRTLDRIAGTWSETYTLGEAQDNHGGPALTIDGEGYLHVLFYSHHHPFRYRRSLKPNDASAWTPFEEFGQNLTYPALVCASDGTLIMTARRSHENRPWELEMWEKSPGKPWQRRSAILRSRHSEYAQFAASLAWGDDHSTLHLASRIYETPTSESEVPITTVVYLRSPDAGITWTLRNGTPVDIPATAETADVIASGRGNEGRVLNAGSIGVNPRGEPAVPYSVRVQDSSTAYLATPMTDGRWRHLALNPFLPPTWRDGDMFMHGGVSFGVSGDPTIAATVMHVPVDGIDWGHTTTELVLLSSSDGGKTFDGTVSSPADPEIPRWMPNLERPTGFNKMPPSPSLLYTEGVRGEGLGDVLSNNVWFVPGGNDSHQ